LGGAAGAACGELPPSPTRVNGAQRALLTCGVLVNSPTRETRVTGFGSATGAAAAGARKSKDDGQLALAGGCRGTEFAQPMEDGGVAGGEEKTQ